MCFGPGSSLDENLRPSVLPNSWDIHGIGVVNFIKGTGPHGFVIGLPFLIKICEKEYVFH